MDKLSGILNMVKFIPVNDAMNIAMLIIMVTGIVAGIIGSAVSIRRYLKV
jgi:cell division protein FtsX